MSYSVYDFVNYSDDEDQQSEEFSYYSSVDASSSIGNKTHRQYPKTNRSSSNASYLAASSSSSASVSSSLTISPGQAHQNVLNQLSAKSSLKKGVAYSKPPKDLFPNKERSLRGGPAKIPKAKRVQRHRLMLLGQVFLLCTMITML